MHEFQNQKIIVLGATSEIGMAIVKRIVDGGGVVLASGRNVGKLKRLSSLYGDSVIAFECDLTNIEDRSALFNESMRFGADFNAMIYAAGFHKLLPISSDYCHGLNEHLILNLSVPLEMIRGFISRKISNTSHQRSIVLVSSVAHRLGEPALSAYSASKGGMVSAVRSLAVELARKNVRVNTVSPGWIVGESALRVENSISESGTSGIRSLYPLGCGEPEDVAEAVAFLASPKSKWITGTDLVVDGGRCCV